MGDEHEGRADLAVDARQLDLHLLAKLEVERAERLVEQQDGGPLGQRPGEGDPLRLTARQLPGVPILHAGQADQLEVLVDATCDLLAGRLSIRRPNATFSATDMCGKSA